MMNPKLENTTGGGDENQMSEIKLGEATYVVHRSYSDTAYAMENAHRVKHQTLWKGGQQWKYF